MGRVHAGIDDIEFLASSPCRVRILDMLSREGRLAGTELDERLDASRATVKRNLEVLAERGWIQRVNGAYAATLLSEEIAEDFATLAETMTVATHLEPFAAALPATFDGDLEDLAGADVTISDHTDPYATVDRHVAAMRAADHYRALLPVPAPFVLGSYGGVDHRPDELVVTSRVVDAPNTPPSGFSVESVLAGGTRLFVHEGDIPTHLVLTDRTVQIGAVDGRGLIRALLETDAETVRAWAEDTYERYRRAATEY